MEPMSVALKRIVVVSALISALSFLTRSVEFLILPLTVYYLLWRELPERMRPGAARRQHIRKPIGVVLYVLSIMAVFVIGMTMFATCGLGPSFGHCSFALFSLASFLVLSLVPVAYFLWVVIDPELRLLQLPILLMLAMIFAVLSVVAHAPMMIVWQFTPTMIAGVEIVWLMLASALATVGGGVIIGTGVWAALLAVFARYDLLESSMEGPPALPTDNLSQS